MTDPVILRHCNGCDAETAHAREQRAEKGPLRVVTEYICSECGTTQTQTEKINE